MRLKSLRIEAFRSVRDKLTIHVQQKLTCLIGANEAGKSTILLGAEMLREGSFGEYDLNTEASPRAERPVIAFTLSLHATDRRRLLKASDQAIEAIQSQPATDELKSTLGALRGLRTHAGARKTITIQLIKQSTRRVVFGGGGWIRVDPPHSTAPNLSAWFADSLPQVILFDPPDDLADDVSLAELEARGNLPFEGLLKLAGLWEQRDLLFTGDLKAHRLLEDGAKRLTREVRKAWSQGSKVTFVLRETQGDRIALRLRDPGTFNVPSLRSLGFRSFFSFYLALFAETEETEPEGFILLFDEPGLHLHPQGQKDLLGELRRLAERNQIIYATHSPFLLDRNDPGSVVLVSKGATKKDQGTKVTYKPHGANWKPLTSALGIVPSDAFFPPDRTLLVEGGSDRIYVSHFMSVLADRLKADLNYLSIVDADRRDELPATLRMLLGAERTIVVAADADQGGDDLRKHLMKLAGSKAKKHLRFIDLSELAATDRPVAIEDLLPRPEWFSALQAYVTDILGDSHQVDRDRIEALSVDLTLAAAAGAYLEEVGVLPRRSAISKTSIAATFVRQDPSVPSKASPVFMLCERITKDLEMSR